MSAEEAMMGPDQKGKRLTGILPSPLLFQLSILNISAWLLGFTEEVVGPGIGRKSHGGSLPSQAADLLMSPGVTGSDGKILFCNLPLTQCAKEVMTDSSSCSTTKNQGGEMNGQSRLMLK
ncbi:unnamed protein product [Natator depressus]